MSEVNNFITKYEKIFFNLLTNIILHCGKVQ